MSSGCLRPCRPPTSSSGSSSLDRQRSSSTQQGPHALAHSSATKLRTMVQTKLELALALATRRLRSLRFTSTGSLNLNVKPGEGSLLPVQGQDPDTSPRLPPTNKFPGHILAAASSTPASLWYCCWEVSKCAPRATQSAWLAVQFRAPGKYWMQLGWPSAPAPQVEISTYATRDGLVVDYKYAWVSLGNAMKAKQSKRADDR